MYCHADEKCLRKLRFENFRAAKVLFLTPSFAVDGF